MKKLLAMMLTASLTLGLVACGGSDGASGSSSNGSGTSNAYTMQTNRTLQTRKTASDGGGGACTGGAVGNPSSNPACTGGSVNAVSGLPSGQTTGDQGNMPPYKCAYCWHRIG